MKEVMPMATMPTSTSGKAWKSLADTISQMKYNVKETIEGLQQLIYEQTFAP